MKKFSNYFPHLLLATYIIGLCFASFNLVMGSPWYVANALPLILVFVLIISYRRGNHLSNFSYLLMAILPVAQIIDWQLTTDKYKNLIDVVEHIGIGLYAYGLIDYLIKYKNYSKKIQVYIISVISVIAIASLYELIEVVTAPTTGVADNGMPFTPSSFDVWDTLKDMLLEFIGTLIASVIYFIKDRF